MTFNVCPVLSIQAWVHCCCTVVQATAPCAHWYTYLENAYFAKINHLYNKYNRINTD